LPKVTLPSVAAVAATAARSMVFVPGNSNPMKATAIQVGGANAGMMFNPKIRPNKRMRVESWQSMERTQ
jgi:hypothetical protein